MCTTARATHDANAFGVNVLMVFEHPIEQNIATSGLIDVGARGMMGCFAHFLFALAPTVKVEIDTDGAHTSQGA